MIKVCHIVNIITGKSDGVYKHLKMIFELSDKKNFEHFLIFQGNEKIEEELKQIEIKSFIIEPLNKKISVNSFIAIYKTLKEIKPAIIHAHLVKPYAIAGLLNILLRKKFIFNYHGLFIYKNPYYNFWERLIYQFIHYVIYLFGRVDSVLVPSEKSKQFLMSQTKLLPEPVVYYNGYQTKNNISVNQEFASSLAQLKSESIIIASVGRLEVDKRIDRAINLTAEVKRELKNIQLLIFGDGTLKEDLQNLTVKLNAIDFVKFYDYIPNIESYFQYFDLILFTSEWEGMPHTLWEAMANKVPVLAPDVGGFSEIIVKNYCGFIYQKGNFNDAKEKLLQLIGSKNLRLELGENGRAAVEKKYNAGNFIKQIEDVYISIL